MSSNSSSVSSNVSSSLKNSSTKSGNKNPLLHPSDLFDNAIPFHEIQKDHYLPAIQESIRVAKEKIEKLKSNQDNPSFQNTIVALETSSEWLSFVMGIFSNLKSADGDERMYALSQEINPLVSAFHSDVLLDADLFRRVEAVVKSQQKVSLTSEQRKLLENTYKSFLRNGANLEPSDKEKLKTLDIELSKLEPEFDENKLKSTNAFELHLTQQEEIEGLPESLLRAAQQTAKEKGRPNGWLFTLQGPSFVGFMTYARNRNLREQMWRAFGAIAYQDNFDNQEIIKKIVQLKDARAKLLGYSNHATYVLEERMAESPKRVESFLSHLLKHSKPAAQRELQELRDFAKKWDRIDILKPWDVAYYSEKLKESLFSFNEEEIRPYFQLESVVNGVFRHAELLYNLEFREANKLPTYHSDVSAYKVYEKSTKQFVGLFYTDFFPRETKRSGAWATEFRNQGLFGDEVRRPHVSIVCNFSKPTPGRPSLLTYDEVRTLFHEMGHALHMLLSDCTYSSLSGAHVYWDFVELPSQIFENWVGEKEGLDLFARHYETGAPLPIEYVQKIKASSQFMAGWMSLRQLSFGFLDFAWHTSDPREFENVTSFEERVLSETQLLPSEKGVNRSCSFGHIFAGGYSAGYYSYKWAEVLDADAFEYFKEKGIFNPDVSLKFRDEVLKRGGTEHPLELYKRFRGRAPDPNALLRRDGLIK